MENEDNLINLHHLIDNPYLPNGWANVITNHGTSGNAEPDFEHYSNNREIQIPKTFKSVILKMYPEIQDIKSAGYRDTVMYNPNTFDPIKNYLVGIDLYFDDRFGMKKSKNEYGKEINDFFKMTYSDMDFVSFHVRSFIFPPEKSNEEKFFELFGKSEV